MSSKESDEATAARGHWLAIARHTPLGLLLDLDGTLIPFAPPPDEAQITPELQLLLSRLVDLPGVTVAIVSGRPRAWLDARLAAIGSLLLVAEHGGWRRDSGAWEPTLQLDVSCLDTLEVELEALERRTPGALLERKTWSLTLHSRRVPAHLKDAFLVEASARVAPFLDREPSFERVDGMARDLDRALRMELPERRARHARLLAIVERTTALSWAEDFLAALSRA